MQPIITPPNFLGSMSTTDTTAVNNPWAPYFGAPERGAIKTSAYDRQRFQNYDLPEAYKGKSLFMADTIDLLVLTGETWYTDVALPIKKTDQNKVTWNVWTFNQHFTDIVPHEGVSRLVTSERRQQKAVFVRRGLALQLEHGFMKTPEGRENYAYNIKQIVSAVNETNNYGVIRAYLTAPSFNAEWEANHGVLQSLTLTEILDRDKLLWAITQRVKNGFEILDAQIKQWMNRFQGRADMWILPPKLQVYLTKVPAHKTDYWLAGPEGPARLHDSVDEFTVFAGNKVFISRQFDVEQQGASMELMMRQRQIGSYYEMFDRYKGSSDGYMTEYESRERTIVIYDEDKDAWSSINLVTALEHAGLFDDEGNLKKPKLNYQVHKYEDDILQDFLLMNSPNPGHLVPIECFGHIRSKHMSVSSITNNVARSLSKHIIVQYSNGLSEVSQILDNGKSLYERISNIPVTEEWFNAIRVQSRTNFASFEKDEFPNILRDAALPPAGEGNVPKIAAAQAKLKSMLTETSKSDRPMFEWKVDPSTNTLPLPQMTIVNKEKKGGGAIVGALAGYGNWDGFNALQHEFLQTTTGDTTRNGYSISMARDAHLFVELVKKIAKHMNFILPGSMFLDPNHTAPYFRRQSSEHVITENLLGMRGLAIWMPLIDQKPISRLSAADDINLYNYMKDMDKQDYQSLNRIWKGVVDKTQDVAFKEAFLKVFGMGVVDDKLTYPPFAAQVDGDKRFTYLSGKENYAERVRALKRLTDRSPGVLPPAHVANQTQMMVRRNLISVLNRLKYEWPRNNNNLPQTSLKSLITAINATTMTDTNIYNASVTDKDIKALNVKLKESRTPSPDQPFTMKLIYEWILKNPKYTTIKGKQEAATFISGLDNSMQQAREADGEHRQEGETFWRVQLRFSETDTDDVIIDTLKVRGGDTAGDPSIRGRIQGEPPLQVGIDDNIQYYRTPLTMSSRQIESLNELYATTAASLGTGAPPYIRVSNYNDSDTYANEAQLNMMAKRIKSLRTGDDRFSKTSPAFFHPDFGSKSKKNQEKELLHSAMISRISSSLQARQGTDGGGIGIGRPISSHRQQQRQIGQKSVRSSVGGDIGETAFMGTTGRAQRRKRRRRGTNSSVNVGNQSPVGLIGRGQYSQNQPGIGQTISETTSMMKRRDPLEEARQIQQFRQEQDFRTIGGGSSSGSTVFNINETFRELYSEVSSSSNVTLFNILSKIYLGTPINKKTLTLLIQHDVVFPMGFIAAQPHKRYSMWMGIKALAGGETGWTYMGNSDFQLEDDAHIKMHYGNYTYYSRSVIHQPKNVWVAYDIYSAGTLGGSGAVPITDDDYNPRGDRYGNGSLLFFAIPYEETDMPNPMDAGGRFKQFYSPQLLDRDALEKLHYSTAPRYNGYWGFLPKEEMASQSLEPMYNEGNAPRNTIMYKGHTWYYSRGSKDYTELQMNTGHWGPNVYVGCRAVRRGDLQEFKDMEYEKRGPRGQRS